MKKNSNTHGFTLIEVLIIVSLTIILGTLTAIFYTRFLSQSNVSNVRDQLISEIRKAQFYSMMSRKSNTSGWGVHNGGSKITLFQGASYAGRNAGLDESISVASSITISGFTDIIYTRVTGLPTPSTATIVLTGPNNLTKQIQINGQGVSQ
jgi:type II secretory pathway component PulJ